MHGSERRGVPATAASRGAGWAALLLLLLQSPACASDLRHEGGRYRHRIGVGVADPAVPGSPWRRVELDGATLAYRGPEAARMSWMVSCGRPLAAPQVLARQLLIGLRGRAVISRGPLRVGDGEGWVQRVTASEGGGRVQMKTVTRVASGCVLDWVLVTPGELAVVEPDFDRWWGSFREAGDEAGGAP